MSTAGQTSRGVTMVSPSTAGGPAPKLQGNGMAGSPGVVPTAVVSAAHIQTSPQAKVLLHMTGQMTVNQARNAVRTGKGETSLQSISKRACLPSVSSSMTDVEESRYTIIKVTNNRK